MLRLHTYGDHAYGSPMLAAGATDAAELRNSDSTEGENAARGTPGALLVAGVDS